MSNYSGSAKGQEAIKKSVGIKSDIASVSHDELVAYMDKASEMDASQKLFKDVFDLLHRTGSDGQVMADIFAHTLRMEHRTHQQAIIKNLYSALRTYGESGKDARNESAVTWAKTATSGDNYFPYI